MLQGYQTREETLNVVRGRIRIEEQLRRRFGIAVPIEVRYDEFTPDIEPNRLLKAAVRRLAWLPQRSPNTRRLLSVMHAVFANVSTVEYRPTHFPEIPVTPLNAHYQPALALARLILKSGAVELAAGKVESASFLVDMNKVFEDFVVVALRDALWLTEYTFPQEARGRDLWLDEGRKVRLKPDLSWWQNDRCVFVGDAKYKPTTVHGAKTHDIYQALAYALAAGLPSALLIYAHDDQDRIDPVTYDIPALQQAHRDRSRRSQPARPAKGDPRARRASRPQSPPTKVGAPAAGLLTLRTPEAERSPVPGPRRPPSRR